jgi:hypothetical protein
MAESNDFARQRLTHFLAARLKARECEQKEAWPAGPGSLSTIASPTAENSAQIAGAAGSTSRPSRSIAPSTDSNRRMKESLSVDEPEKAVSGQKSEGR